MQCASAPKPFGGSAGPGRREANGSYQVKAVFCGVRKSELTVVQVSVCRTLSFRFPKA